MNVAARPLHEITEQAIRVLAREIGIADTIRFLNQFSSGYGDYTKERDDLFGDVSFEEIISVAQKVRERER